MHIIRNAPKELIEQAAHYVTTPLRGSSSPAYVDVRWKTSRQTGLSDQLTHFFEGDPESRFVPPRFWKLAAALAIESVAYDTLQAARPDARPALAHQVGEDTVKTAVIPAELGSRNDANIPVRLVALGIGSGVVRAALGFQDEAGVFEPAETQMHGAIFRIDELSAHFPETPLIYPAYPVVHLPLT